MAIEWDMEIAHAQVCDLEPEHGFNDCPDEHYDVPAYALFAVLVQLEDLALPEKAAVLVQAMIVLMEEEQVAEVGWFDHDGDPSVVFKQGRYLRMDGDPIDIRLDNSEIHGDDE